MFTGSQTQGIDFKALVAPWTAFSNSARKLQASEFLCFEFLQRIFPSAAKSLSIWKQAKTQDRHELASFADRMHKDGVAPEVGERITRRSLRAQQREKSPKDWLSEHREFGENVMCGATSLRVSSLEPRACALILLVSPTIPSG